MSIQPKAKKTKLHHHTDNDPTRDFSFETALRNGRRARTNLRVEASKKCCEMESELVHKKAKSAKADWRRTMKGKSYNDVEIRVMEPYDGLTSLTTCNEEASEAIVSSFEQMQEEHGECKPSVQEPFLDWCDTDYDRVFDPIIPTDSYGEEIPLLELLFEEPLIDLHERRTLWEEPKQTRLVSEEEFFLLCEESIK